MYQQKDQTWAGQLQLLKLQRIPFHYEEYQSRESTAELIRCLNTKLNHTFLSILSCARVFKHSGTYVTG